MRITGDHYARETSRCVGLHANLRTENRDLSKDKGTGLVFGLSQLSLHPFNPAPEPPIMNELLLHTCPEAGYAAVIGEDDNGSA